MIILYKHAKYFNLFYVLKIVSKKQLCIFLWTSYQGLGHLWHFIEYLSSCADLENFLHARYLGINPCALELHLYRNWFDSTRPQSYYFTILPILHKTLVTVTKVFHGCTDQHFTLSGVTFHAKQSNLNCL